jgi:hypothetical protein
MNLHLVLLVFAFVCFVLSTFPPTQPYWSRLVGAGLAFWVASVLFG